MSPDVWQVHNSEGRQRVIVTRDLPGQKWLEILVSADCRVEVHTGQSRLPLSALEAVLGRSCQGVIGQLTEPWDAAALEALVVAGGKVYSNYAVGYNNVDMAAATRLGLPVGNTPGVLTTATAEMAVALTLAAARRMGEAERYLRAGKFTAWHPTLLMGTLLEGATVGIIGAGRIGCAYARMMVAGFKMNLVYFSRRPNPDLERWAADHNQFLTACGDGPLACYRAETIEALLESADVVSIHTPLTESTRHLIHGPRLRSMRPQAILINTSRGPVIDEAALVAHCRQHPRFRAGLDVYEDEPALSPGLDALENVVLMPHLGSATRWSREGMATLAALNVAGVLQNRPLWPHADMVPFLTDQPPLAVPSLVNAEALGYPPMENFKDAS